MGKQVISAATQLYCQGLSMLGGVPTGANHGGLHISLELSGPEYGSPDRARAHSGRH